MKQNLFQLKIEKLIVKIFRIIKFNFNLRKIKKIKTLFCKTFNKTIYKT